MNERQQICERVRPTQVLETMRPELAGDTGEILWREPTEVVVRFTRQPKPYRVPLGDVIHIEE